MQKLFLTTIIFLFISLLTWAIDDGNTFKFYHLNTSNELSQNTIHCILNDKNGYMWFGTDGGLNRWNGYKFITYTHDPNNPKSIGQGRINCFLEDEKSNIWIGTLQGGVSCYVESTNSFDVYFNTNDSMHDQRNNVYQIIKINDFIIYGTFGSGLYTLNTNNRKITPVKIYNKSNEDIDNLIVQKLIIDSDSNLWIGHGKGLIKVQLSQTSDNYTKMYGEEFLQDENVLSIYECQNKDLLVGTQFAGAYKYNEPLHKLEAFEPTIDSKEMNQSVIRDFIEDKYQNLWIATDGNGIFVLNKKNKRFEHYKSELNNIFTLSSNNIYCLYIDRSKNIWAGTYNTGINYINYHKQSFNHIRGFGAKNELSNNAILSFYELDNGNMLIGTDGDGINIFNPQTRDFTPFNLPIDKKSKTKSVVVCMAKDKQDNLYIGTYLNGLFIYNLKTKSFKNYRSGTGQHELKNNNIWSIAFDSSNAVWLGTLGSGISWFNPKTELFYNYSAKMRTSNSITNDYISNILLDKSDSLWIATHNYGINLLIDKEKGLFKSFQNDNSCGLSSNDIWKIYEDSKNNFWIATHDGGLCLLNRNTRKFKVFNMNDGLPSNTIKSIIEDNQGNLWLGTNNGLSKVTYIGDSLIVKNYSLQDGLQSNEFNFGAAYKAKNGYLYFGGNNGFNFFHPDSIIEPKTVGSIIIDDFTVLYHDNYTGKSVSLINELKRNHYKFTLNFNAAIISIEYALLDFTVPELNTYEYILEGFDKGWIKAKNNRSVTYTNLDPGTYTFRVKGKNSQGIVSENEATILLIIKPPYWGTIWFKILIGLFVLIIIALIYWFREATYRKHERMLKNMVTERTKELLELNKVLADRNTEIHKQSEELKVKSDNLVEVNTNLEKSHQQIEKQNEELEQHRNNLEQLVKQRTEQLEKAKEKAEESERLKMAFLANMSHEIRTPMNAIMGFSSLLIEEGFSNEERFSFSKLINSNGQSLLFLIDDILDLSKIEANQLTIIHKTSNFIDLIDEIKNNWTIIRQESPSDVVFETQVQFNTNELMVCSDNQRIKQIINNLIDNAFKFTQKGSVQLSSSLVNDQIITKVTDSGIGIDAQDLSKIFYRFRKSNKSIDKSFRGAGLGLTISKKLAELLGGKLEVESKIGVGSTFTFTLPYSNSL